MGRVKEACSTFSGTFLLPAVLSAVIAMAGLLFPENAAILPGAGHAAPEALALTAVFPRVLRMSGGRTNDIIRRGKRTR